MTNARFVAQMLSKRFLAEGKIVAASSSIGTREEGLRLASEQGKKDVWEKTEAFTKLAVVSVGFREGKHGLDPDVDAKPEVVVFAAGRPPKKLIDSLPKIIDGVRVVVLKTAAAGINPEQAVTDTDEPKSFEYKGRIACGSSCATATGSPGSMGALVKRQGEEATFLLSCNHVIAACNQINLGMPILAPAPSDSKPHGVLPVSIARLDQMVPLRFGVPGSIPPCEEDVASAAFFLRTSSLRGRVTRPDTTPPWTSLNRKTGWMSKNTEDRVG